MFFSHVFEFLVRHPNKLTIDRLGFKLTLAVGAVRILQPCATDVYSSSQHAIENYDEDLTHVIEIYDFSSNFKTEDIFNGRNL